MKKIILTALMIGSGLAFASCINGDNENHGTSIYNSHGQMAPIELYADQTLDSLFVMSYDSWSARTENADWFEVSDKTCKVPANYIVTQSVLIKATPNTTGKARVGQFIVNSEYAEYGPLSTSITQYGWLNITAPVAQYVQEDDKDKGEKYVVAKFEAPVGATDEIARLACTVYADATLTSDAAWLSVPSDVQTLKPGSHGVQFNVTANSDAAERVAHVTLTSNGVSSVITYTQKGKK